MRRLPEYSPALLFAIAVVACAKQGSPTPAPMPADPPVPRAVAAVTAGDSPLTVQVLEVRRTGSDVLTVSLQLVNTGGPGQLVSLRSLFAAEARDEGTLADMFLWDEAGQRKYYVLRDTADRPRTSARLADLAPGAPRRVWAAFPAPPAGVARLTICLPHLAPMPGVPIS
jgi:hypothetical protein